MRKNYIDKNDPYRVLLSDVLPYELPLLFSNLKFHHFIFENNLDKGKNKSTNSYCNFLANLLVTDKKNYTIPFSYEIRKGKIDYRTLSVIHPYHQIEICNLYRKYALLILYACNRSKFSLRHPKNVARTFIDPFYEKKINHLNDTEDNEKTYRYASTYFLYKKFSYLYKFFNSYDFVTREQKFAFLRQLDISKCFNHIYTHSVAWAITSKQYEKSSLSVKRNKENLPFGSHLDTLAQAMNYKETNGILVGSEFARIFAEIILQRCDCEIESILLQRNLHLGDKYDIKRYVDDYFIFTNEIKLSEEIEKIISHTLEQYKLYLNVAKTTTLQRPFVTAIDVSKQHICTYVNSLFSSFYNETNEKIQLNLRKSSSSTTTKAISVLRTYFFGDEELVSKTTSYALVAFRNKLVSSKLIKLCQDSNKNDDDFLLEILISIIRITFYIYSLCNRVRQTYLISEIYCTILKIAKTKGKLFLDGVKKEIFDKFKLAIKSLAKEKYSSIELSNLLIVLQQLGSDYLLSEEELKQIVKQIKVNFKELNYFHICSLLYYVRDRKKFKSLRQKILTEIFNRFQLLPPEIEKNTELVLLLVDCLACPYLTNLEKQQLLTYFPSANKLQISTKTDIPQNNKKCISFFDWFFSGEIEQALMTKELHSPYE